MNSLASNPDTTQFTPEKPLSENLLPDDFRLISHKEYLALLKPLIPSEAFQKRFPVKKSVIMIIHIILIAMALLIARKVGLSWVLVPLILCIGHSMACMAFLAHEISHGAVYRNRVVRRAMEALAWGPIMMPVAIWRRIHNQLHHVKANTPEDCDRSFLKEERSLFSEIFLFSLIPHSSSRRGNVFVWCYFFVYTIRNIITALLFGGKRMKEENPFAPYYGWKTLKKVLLDMIPIIMIHISIFWALGESWSLYILCGLSPVLIASSILMMYIYTNHLTNPITEECDPVFGTTSVIVPRLFNMLHSNFSYHTEHHLFPAMDSKFYPLVSDLLLRYYPERYNRIPLPTALQLVWRKYRYVEVLALPHKQNSSKSTTNVMQ